MELPLHNVPAAGSSRPERLLAALPLPCGRVTAEDSRRPRRGSGGVVHGVTALLFAALLAIHAPLSTAQRPPPPSPPNPPPNPPPPPSPPPPVVTVAAAACSGSSLLPGGSTVTYTIPSYTGLTPVVLAAGINQALATSAVTGLEAAGVSALWSLGNSIGGSGALFSTATGMLCGFVQNGVLNRSGFPAASGGAAVSLGAASGGYPPPPPAYVGTPTTLVCSSCVSWTAPPAAACAPAHRFTPSIATSGQMTQMVKALGQNNFAVTGTAYNLSDAGASPSATPLYTGFAPYGPQRAALVRIVPAGSLCGHLRHALTDARWHRCTGRNDKST